MTNGCYYECVMRYFNTKLRPGFAPAIIIVILAALAILFGGYFFYRQLNPANPLPKLGGGVACTVEAKLCPDGSYVGRTGPNCAFASCPGPNPTPTPAPGGDCSGPGGACPSGYTCIQKCGPPVVYQGAPPPGYYCATNDVASKPRMCPICLASNAMIDTPTGEVNVKAIKIGMTVWSMDKKGKKIASKVLKVGSMTVPSTHLVVHLVMSDHRELWVSPNHPLIDGRPVSALKPGNVYNGAKVISADLIPFWDNKTYDLLPDSPTGEYWADKILLGSTLK